MNFLTLEVIFGKENPYVQIWQKKFNSKPTGLYLYIVWTCSVGYFRRLSNISHIVFFREARIQIE